MISLKELLDGVMLNSIWPKLLNKELVVIRPFEIVPQTATQPNIKLQPGQIVKVITDPKQGMRVQIQFEGEKYTTDATAFLNQIKINKR
jgi:hypothetical protein